MPQQGIPTIILIGFSRPNANSDVVKVTAQFTAPDPFTGELTSNNREIDLSDSGLGADWNEDDIQSQVSSDFPGCAVQWMPAQEPVEQE